MSEQEVSHIEIAEASIQDLKPEQSSKRMLKILADVEGWKKDAKKIGLIILAVLLLLGMGWGLGQLKNYFSWGVRWQVPLKAMAYQTYDNPEGKFSFRYPARYVFDGDQQKKFGADYLAGFHLQADSRTGCDVRASEVGINFAKSDQEIAQAVSRELAANVKGFEKFNGTRIKVGNKDAYQTSFALTDPLGNKLRITQVLVSAANNENYLLVCGSGEAQAEFFTPDFADFLQSFSLKA